MWKDGKRKGIKPAKAAAACSQGRGSHEVRFRWRCWDEKLSPISTCLIGKIGSKLRTLAARILVQKRREEEMGEQGRELFSVRWERRF